MYSRQDRIIQCAQCARAHEASLHWRPHLQADVKIVMLKFVICTEITTTEKGHQFLRWKKYVVAPPKAVPTLPR